MEDLKIFEEVSLECDEKGTMPYRGGHSTARWACSTCPGRSAVLSTTTGLTAEEAAEAIRAAKTVLGKRLVILVHHYQRDDVYQHADLTGDSFKLSRQSADVDAEYVVFCGVHFMAESADILSRDDQVVIARPLRRLLDGGHGRHRPGGGVLGRAGFRSRRRPRTAGHAGHVHELERRAQGVLRPARRHRLHVDERARSSSGPTSSGGEVLFFPDQHLGRNTAKAMGIPLEEMVLRQRPWLRMGASSRPLSTRRA